jgi:hypothetical protein
MRVAGRMRSAVQMALPLGRVLGNDALEADANFTHMPDYSQFVS